MPIFTVFSITNGRGKTYFVGATSQDMNKRKWDILNGARNEKAGIYTSPIGKWLRERLETGKKIEFVVHGTFDSQGDANKLILELRAAHPEVLNRKVKTVMPGRPIDSSSVNSKVSVFVKLQRQVLGLDVNDKMPWGTIRQARIEAKKDTK